MMATKIEIKQDHRYSFRSQQVLAVTLICSLTIFILMSVCLMSSYWITAEGFRQGLLYLCIEEPAQNSRIRYEPLPFNLNKDGLEPGCYPNRDVGEYNQIGTQNILSLMISQLTSSIDPYRTGYLKICTFFCLITQLSAIASACLTALSLRFRGLKKTSTIRFAVCTTLVTLLCDIALIIIYPTQFAKEIDKSNRELWELNGAFGLACGAGILAFGSLISLVAVLRKSTTMYEAAPTRI